MDGALLDGTSSSRPDRLDARIGAERQRKAALAVAHRAVDVDDCAELLAMLGLTPQDGLTNRKAAS
jgi:hypothetical protein